MFPEGLEVGLSSRAGRGAMIRVFSVMPASTRSAAAMYPSIRPPLEASMNG